MLVVGTSGFSYDDWVGKVYPEGTKKNEMFSLYAQQFKSVEINSTFYALTGPGLFERLLAKAPEGFGFSVKAYKGLTHEVESETFGDLMVKYRQELSPLVEAGGLQAVLCQFPWKLKPEKAAKELLERLVGELGDLPLVFEFRNQEWMRESVFEWMTRHKVGFCSVDEPQLKGLMPPEARATSEIGYIRFHGRNSAKWWHHTEAWERYDYLYNMEEIREWLPKIRQLEATTQLTMVYFNNHYAGQAVKNAEMLLELMGD